MRRLGMKSLVSALMDENAVTRPLLDPPLRGEEGSALSPF